MRLWPVIFLLLCLAACARKGQPISAPQNYIEIEGVTVRPATYHPMEEMKFRLLHTRLDLEPNWKERTLKGEARLTLLPYAYPQDSLVLDAKTMDIASVRDLDEREDAQLPYRYDGKELTIDLRRTRRPGKDTLHLFIAYTARPEKRWQGPDSITAIDEQGLVFINPDGKDSLMPRQMWTQGETEFNSVWMPTLEQTSQKMTQEIWLTVEKDLATLSNGELWRSEPLPGGKRRDVWRLNLPHAPYLSMIAAGDWQVVRDGFWRGVPLEYYVEPKYAPYAKMVFGKTPAMMEFFSQKLGFPFPWPSFRQIVLRDFPAGAMENTTAVTHFEGLQHDSRAHIDETHEDIISHELFHHWFGDLVTCESWAQVAMNESFATMGELLWIEHAYGRDEEELHRLADLQSYLRESIYKKDPIIQYHYGKADDLFDRHRYQKGGLVLHMLRKMLGEEVFFKGLHEYVKSRAFKTTEVHLLRESMEEASGQDLQWFFDQWFFRPGHPELEIRHEYDTANKGVILRVKQVQEGEAYRLPVRVDVHSFVNHVMGLSQHKFMLTKKADSFFIPFAHKPVNVNFDVDKYLLCAKREYKNTSAWLYQLKNDSGFLNQFEAIEALQSVKNRLTQDTIGHIVPDVFFGNFNWRITQAVIEGFFLPQKVPYYDKYKSWFRHTASQHKDHPRVRRAALEVVRLHEGDSARQIYLEAAEDSSYRVAGTALDALFSSAKDSVLLRGLAKRYAPLDAPEVALVLTDYYSRSGAAADLPYLRAANYRLSPWYSGQILSNYRRLLLRQDAHYLRQELPHILRLRDRYREAYSRSNYKSFLIELSRRIAAGYQGMGLGKEEAEGMIKTLNDQADRVGR